MRWVASRLSLATTVSSSEPRPAWSVEAAPGRSCVGVELIRPYLHRNTMLSSSEVVGFLTACPQEGPPGQVELTSSPRRLAESDDDRDETGGARATVPFAGRSPPNRLTVTRRDG